MPNLGIDIKRHGEDGEAETGLGSAFEQELKKAKQRQSMSRERKPDKIEREDCVFRSMTARLLPTVAESNTVTLKSVLTQKDRYIRDLKLKHRQDQLQEQQQRAQKLDRIYRKSVATEASHFDIEPSIKLKVN